MDLSTMPIYDDFGMEIAHYENKLNVVSQQMDDAIKSMVEAGILMEDGWDGCAGNAAKELTQEMVREMKNSRNDVDDALSQLRMLKNSIAEHIEEFQTEWRKQQDALSTAE